MERTSNAERKRVLRERVAGSKLAGDGSRIYLDIIAKHLTRDDSSWRHQPPGVPPLDGGLKLGLRDSFVSISLTCRQTFLQLAGNARQ